MRFYIFFLILSNLIFTQSKNSIKNILLDKEYAETDKPATLISKNSVTNSTGIRIHLQDQRMEFLDNVQTTIETNRKN